MKKTTLVIMAAGLGSRFGGGIKQLEPVGMNGEIIMDYSIHDAIQAGFNKLVFIIRRDIEKDFMERIGSRVSSICSRLDLELEYCFQDLDAVPAGMECPPQRTKPWGTGQAVLAAKDLIHEPFAVINADDYYGRESFRKMHDWLAAEHQDTAIAMAGFILKNTLSENGGVTRGICQLSDGHTHITDVVETKNIVKSTSGVESDGRKLNPDSFVSMNFWGFPAGCGDKPLFLDSLAQGFSEFFQTAVPNDPLKAEFLLPIHIGGLLRQGKCTVKVLATAERWFGVTYKQDKPFVVDNFRNLIRSGVYSEDLYSDL